MTIAPATALVTVADAVAATVGDADSDLLVYAYEPRDLDTLPAATVGEMELERRNPDDHEMEVGSREWRVTVTVRLYDLAPDPEVSFNAMRLMVGKVIDAFDRDDTLGGTVYDASVTAARFGVDDEQDERRRVIAELDVQAIVLTTLT